MQGFFTYFWNVLPILLFSIFLQWFQDSQFTISVYDNCNKTFSLSFGKSSPQSSVIQIVQNSRREWTRIIESRPCTWPFQHNLKNIVAKLTTTVENKLPIVDTSTLYKMYYILRFKTDSIRAKIGYGNINPTNTCLLCKDWQQGRQYERVERSDAVWDATQVLKTRTVYVQGRSSLCICLHFNAAGYH